MCGIFAYAGNKKINIEASLSELAHRGPDHTGSFADQNVTLGHCRLSIIDTDERSNQPMTSASGCLTIVFNGEIYNYAELRDSLIGEGLTFRTKGDTEVILNGYEHHGIKFFDRLRGMWAFVIYDHKKNTLVAARDPFGIKPLYYGHFGESIYFTSEIRALKKIVPLEPNPAAYPAFYNLGYFLAPETPYKNVWKLHPGEILEYDLAKKKLISAGRVSRFIANPIPAINSYEEAVDYMDHILAESVKAHYVSDVPVSILLSGGTDSSLIAALSKKIGKKPIAYHVSIADSQDTFYAEAIAKHLDIDLVIAPLTQAALVAQYDKVWDILDEPTGDISIIPTSLVFEKVKGKVVLSGEGGDELFSGYLRHQMLGHHSKVSEYNTANTMLNSLLLNNNFGLSLWNPLVERLRISLLKLGLTDDMIGAYLTNVRLISYPLSDKKIRSLFFKIDNKERDSRIPPMLAYDMLSYLPNDLLPKSDIASMASSIEARVPFVDRFVANATTEIFKVIGVPAGDKRILKEILGRYIPQELAFRGKSGFGVPMNSYDSKEFVSDFIKACEFHLKNRKEFGVDDTIVKLIENVSSRQTIARKFPRFAFALISNWKFFML